MADFKHIPSTPTLGLGCWAIGGPFSMDGRAVGWGVVDDDVSKAAIAEGVAQGILHFDTAQAYGCGHSEVVLGQALKAHPEVAIATKIGLGIDTAAKTLAGIMPDPAAIKNTIAASRQRLQRDCINLILLHPNDMSIEDATPIFDMLDDLIAAGWIKGYGWSTDFPERLAAFEDRAGFVAVEHAMNVFLPANHMTNAVQATDVNALIRSPLAMGILGGRYDRASKFKTDDVRGAPDPTNRYFTDGQINAEMMNNLDAVRDIITSGGRSLAQGAIAWLWARSPGCMPIPGFRTPEQVADLCGAVSHGPLSNDQLAEIETLLTRPPEGPPMAR
jgi:aryl-alcohol dehydrogenase-like predicted oxidoreductase